MNRTETSTFPVLSERDQGDRQETDVPAVDARTLTNGGATATITLDDQQYTLRITRTKKLILTK